LLAPPHDPLSVRSFDYGQLVTIEGALIREPERLAERTRLYVGVERAAAAGGALRPAHGVVGLQSSVLRRSDSATKSG
jgi:hypothetical protein